MDVKVNGFLWAWHFEKKRTNLASAQLVAEGVLMQTLMLLLPGCRVAYQKH